MLCASFCLPSLPSLSPFLEWSLHAMSFPLFLEPGLQEGARTRHRTSSTDHLSGQRPLGLWLTRNPARVNEPFLRMLRLRKPAKMPSHMRPQYSLESFVSLRFCAPVPRQATRQALSGQNPFLSIRSLRRPRQKGEVPDALNQPEFTEFQVPSLLGSQFSQSRSLTDSDHAIWM